jgi:hypothetical protein
MPRYVALEGGGHVQRCPNCEQDLVVYVDEGKLDLNVQRDVLSGADNDFRLFGETFERTARLTPRG